MASILLISTHQVRQVTKTWRDGNDRDGLRADAITVNLLKNGKSTDEFIELNTENNWSNSFTNLDMYEAGELLEYSLEEVSLDNDYEANISGSQAKNFRLTNIRQPELIDIEVNKVWDDADDQDGVRPDTITIYLLKDGKKLDSKEVSAEDNWSTSFTNLFKYEAGEEINYSIEEKELADDYSTEITVNEDASFTVTNSRETDKISVNGSVIWHDHYMIMASL